jgi:hypothetical protein
VTGAISNPALVPQLLSQMQLAKQRVMQLALLNHIATDDAIDPHPPAHKSCVQSLLHCINFSVLRLENRVRGPVKDQPATIAGQAMDIGQSASLNLARMFAEKVPGDLQLAVTEMRRYSEASLVLANANHAMTLEEAIDEVKKERGSRGPT